MQEQFILETQNQRTALWVYMDSLLARLRNLEGYFTGNTLTQSNGDFLSEVGYLIQETQVTNEKLLKLISVLHDQAVILNKDIKKLKKSLNRFDNPFLLPAMDAGNLNRSAVLALAKIDHWKHLHNQLNQKDFNDTLVQDAKIAIFFDRELFQAFVDMHIPENELPFCSISTLRVVIEKNIAILMENYSLFKVLQWESNVLKSLHEKYNVALTIIAQLPVENVAQPLQLLDENPTAFVAHLENLSRSITDQSLPIEEPIYYGHLSKRKSPTIVVSQNVDPNVASSSRDATSVQACIQGPSLLSHQTAKRKRNETQPDLQCHQAPFKKRTQL